MPCAITVSDDGKYIIQKVTGDITRDLAMEYNLATHTLGGKLGISRYLVDVTESRNLSSVIDNYSFAHADMASDGIDLNAHVAMLVSPDDHSHDFVETVSRNAGLHVTLFRDRTQAERHLLDS